VLARRPGPFARRRLVLRACAPLVAVLLALLAAAPALAEIRDRPGETPATQVDTTPLPPGVVGSEDGSGTGASAAGAIAKTVVGLGIVLAVIFGVYWLLKSAGRSKRVGLGWSHGAIELISTTALAQGKTLHLVRVGDDVVLVGAAEQSVTRVQSWTGDDARRLEILLQQPRGGSGGPPVTGFGPRLVEELRRRTVRG
jgi:flagellar protein FliO/FliZ